MKKILLIIGAVVSALLLCLFITMGVENRAIAYEENIENAESAIRVEEKRRIDLIPNLVETVKEYDSHEYETMMSIVNARRVNGTCDVDEIKMMIDVVAEAYPDLKSQKNYQDLMNELAITENKIADNRKFYNMNVTGYRRYIRQFPSKQILSLAGYEVKKYERLDFEDVSGDAPKIFK